MITYNEARTMMSSAIDRGNGKRKKLGNNTYLHERGNDYAIRLHYTDIITIHQDGTFSLNTGGWETVTTKARLNGYGPSAVYSVDGTWCVINRDDPKTAPNVKKCRACKGTGQKHSPAHYRTHGYNDAREWVKLDPPEEIYPASDYQCYSCSGTGECDYGSKSRPVKFYDGIRVDSFGEVIDTTWAERMYETPEERAERDARIAEEIRNAKRNEKRNWLRAYGLTARRGFVTLYKAVDDNLRSGYQFHYPIGQTVACDDFRPNRECGNGLHFCPTPDLATRYFPEASRWLACEVRVKDMIVLDDKVKAPSARVLYEVSRAADRIAV